MGDIRGEVGAHLLQAAQLGDVLDDRQGADQLVGLQETAERSVSDLDCMCGSGTLPIEAAMFAMKIPAGYYRKQWGFMKWDDWDPELWQRIKEEADSQICEFDHEIWASDRSPEPPSRIILRHVNI